MVDCIMFSKRCVPADVQPEAGAPSYYKSERRKQEGFVNRTICSQARLVFLLLALLVLALTACERPLQSREVLEAPSPTPMLAPAVLPTPLPAIPESPAGEVVQPEGEGAAEEVPPDTEAPPGAEAPPATQPEPPPATQPVEPAPTGPVTYVVQAGDTLGRIAQRYNVSVEEIAAANQITNIHRLEVGQTLTIPVGGVTAVPTGETIHVVQRGETLFRIALRYGMTAEELAAHNGLANINLIYPGQELRIPAR
jgi:LysM repeat protein